MKRVIGETVVHKAHGLCTIKNIETIGDKEYYKVVPHAGEKVTIYVPCEFSDSIFIKVMSKIEADNLLRYMKTINEEGIVMDKQRRDDYKRKIAGGDRKELAYLVRTLFILREEKHRQNMTLGSQDQNLLERASTKLLDEFSQSYKVPREEIEDYIKNRYMKIN